MNVRDPDEQAQNIAGKDPTAPVWRDEIHGARTETGFLAREIYEYGWPAAKGFQSPQPRHSLMPMPPHFCGRARELAVLERHAGESDAVRRLAIVVIRGMAGLGKTSLAAYWLESVRDRYRGEILFANLRGDQKQPTAPQEIINGFLQARGMAPQTIPDDEHEQAALYRLMTTGERTVVFLDNAATAAQVRDLLPGPGPAAEPETSPREPGQRFSTRPSLVLVTSRRRIAELAMDGAKYLELPPLEQTAAAEFFERVVGSDRVTAEEEASRKVVELCGGNPLAVRVSGARLMAHPTWSVSRVARELGTESARLSSLSLGDEQPVRAAFDASYRVLPDQVASAYRTVALIPGPEFSADLATAALNDEHSQRLLNALVDASLLNETADGRYFLHDLIRLHAREQFGAGSADERRAIIARSVDWYLRQAVAADRVVLPGRWRLGPLFGRPDSGQPAYADAAEASQWLEAALPGLLAALEAAHGNGLHQSAWQLCEALWGILLFGKHYEAWQTSHKLGLSSAQACGDRKAEAQMHVQLGAAHRSLRDLDTAAEHFSQALELFRAAGHLLGEASAHDQLGLVHLRRGRYDEAISDFRRALEIHEAIGRPRGIALMKLNIGQALAAAGHCDDAVRYFQQADQQFDAIDEQYHRARTLMALGDARVAAGQAAAAEEPLRDALAITEKLGAAYDRAHAHVHIADMAEALGDHARSTRHLVEALALFDTMNAPQAASVRARLGDGGQRMTGAAD